MPLPAALREGVLSRFASAVGADCLEAEKPLREYVSLLDFFTRRLKPGLRPQAPPVEGGINSPVDGELIASGRIEEGALIQAKGLPYRLDELLGPDPLAGRFAGGHFATLYLSPKDYHRIHVPCEGLCRSVARIEGELWPVNAASTAHTPRLYVRNRRSTWIAEGAGSDEGLWIGAVLVAATHVGGAVIDGRWLGGRTLPARGRLEVNGLAARPGDDLGTFELGSSVILLIGGEKAGRWAFTRGFGLVRVGERLGALA